MNWRLSHRFDPRAVALADRHYNRQKPGTPQFVPPGRCIVLLGSGFDALWVTSWPFAEFTHHAWAGAWINSTFRRESGPRASDLILEAAAITRGIWPDVPAHGLVSFVDADAIRPKRDPGRCYLRAGFSLVGQTAKRGFLAFQLLPEAMPAPLFLAGSQLELATAPC